MGRWFRMSVDFIEIIRAIIFWYEMNMSKHATLKHLQWFMVHLLSNRQRALPKPTTLCVRWTMPFARHHGFQSINLGGIFEFSFFHSSCRFRHGENVSMSSMPLRRDMNFFNRCRRRRHCSHRQQVKDEMLSQLFFALSFSISNTDPSLGSSSGDPRLGSEFVIEKFKFRKVD